MNSKTLVFVLCLLLVAVDSKSMFSGRGFQTSTSIKRSPHPEPTVQNEDNRSFRNGNNGQNPANVMGFLKWKLKVQLQQ